MARRGKLTDEQREAIREEYANGSTYAEIGEKYGVSHTAVWRYCDGVKKSDKREVRLKAVEKAKKKLIEEEAENLVKTNGELLFIGRTIRDMLKGKMNEMTARIKDGGTDIDIRELEALARAHEKIVATYRLQTGQSTERSESSVSITPPEQVVIRGV